MKSRTEVRAVTYGTVYCMESTYKTVENSKGKKEVDLMDQNMENMELTSQARSKVDCEYPL